MARRTLEKAEAGSTPPRGSPSDLESSSPTWIAPDERMEFYRRLQNIRAAEAIRAAPPPLPGRGPYAAATLSMFRGLINCWARPPWRAAFCPIRR